MRHLIRLIVLAGILTLPAHAAAPPAVEAEHGMVVSAQRLAAEAGIAILKQGGNAIDAAVAAGYVEAVVNPCCGNIGGGGFLLARMADGREVFVDFRETAPASASRDMYLGPDGQPSKSASLYGWRAVGVPGTVAGFELALQRYGSLPRSVVMAPAIALAAQGFELTRGDTDIIARYAPLLRKNADAARIFLRPDGSLPEPGDRLTQPELAATLRAIAEHGPDAFYRGTIPAAIAAASDGALTEADFSTYAARTLEPVRCGFAGATVLSSPPPSSGGTALCEILNILSGYDLKASGHASARTVSLMVEAMRHAYVDRNTWLGDPAFVKNPLPWLLSADHAAAIRGRIGDKATPSAELRGGLAPHEKPETTHYSVVDSRGNAVAVTYTINGAFGAGVMAPNAGFLLNNEMDDFTAKPGAPNLFGLIQGEANAIAPGKRPLSSMSPTIVLRDGKPAIVLGSPGGSRIITIVLQSLLNMTVHGMAPQEAVNAPRIHHQWQPDTVFAEPFALSPDTKALLQAAGYKISEQTPWGAVALIAVGPAEEEAKGPASSGNDATATRGMRPGRLYGANDPRRPAGAAIGY